jgi:hypothetical protein
MEMLPKLVAKNFALAYANYRESLAIFSLSPTIENQRELQMAALNFEIWGDVAGIHLVDHETLKCDIKGRTLVLKETT